MIDRKTAEELYKSAEKYKRFFLNNNIIAGVGFVKERSGYYVPNTVIKEDIRDITNNCVRVIAIYKKHKNDAIYNKLIYLAKKVDLSYYDFPQEYEYLKSITY